MPTLFDSLIKLHGLLWSGDDTMDQDSLFEAQETIDGIIILLAKKGYLKIEQLPNGYILKISRVYKT